MRLAGPGRAAGGASAPTSPSSGSSRASSSPQVRTVTFASSPPTGHVRVGRVRDAQQQVVELGLDLGQLGVERGDPLAGRDRRGLELGDLRAVRLRAALDRLADPLRGGVALGLEAVALAEQLRAARASSSSAPVDDRRVLALVDRALADDVRLVAEPLQADAHAAASGSAGRPAPSAGLAQPLDDELRLEARRAASRRAGRSAGRGTRGRAPRRRGRPAARLGRRPRRSAPARRRRVVGRLAPRRASASAREEARAGRRRARRRPSGSARAGPRWRADSGA